MLVCANKNTKEYQELSNLFGEDVTDYLFEQNNYVLPNVNMANNMLNNLSNTGEIITFDIAETNPINSVEAFKTIQELIPDIKQEEVVFVHNLINGKKGGEFRKGIMSFYTNDNKIDSKIVKHEIFHKLWNQYIPRSEKDNINNNLSTYTAYKTWLKDKPDNDINREEFLAEGFQDYINTGKSSVLSLKRFYEWIKNIIYRIAGINRQLTPSKIDTLYKNIYANNYNIQLVENIQLENLPKFLKQVQIVFPQNTKAESIIEFHLAKLQVKSVLAKYIEEGYTIEGAVFKTKADIAKQGIKAGVGSSFKNLNLEGTELEYILSLEPELRTLYYLSKNGASNVGLIAENLFPTFNDNKTYEELKQEYDEAVNTGSTVGDAAYSEMLENVKTDFESKLNKTVKSYLTLVEVNGRFMHPAHAYVLTLKVYEEFNFNKDVVALSKELKAAVQPNKGKNDYEIAIINKLNNLISNSIEQEDILEGLDVIFPADKMLATYNGKEYFERNSKGEPIVTNSSITQLARAIAFDNGLDKSIVQKQLEGLRNRNVFRQLYSELGSLANNNPIVMSTNTEKNRESGYDEIMYKVKKLSPNSISTSYKENITTFLTLFNDFTIDGLRTATGVDLPFNQVQIKRLNFLLGKIKKAGVEKSETYIKGLADVFSQNDDSVQAQNYFDSKNNRRYLWSMGAWLNNAYRLIKEGIYNYNYSAFKEGLIDVGSIVSLDAYETVKYNNKIQQVQYQNFKPKDFFNAHFFGGFVSIITQGSNTPKYYQPLYTQSNRPTDDFVEITYSDESKLKEIANLNRKWQTETIAKIAEVKALLTTLPTSNPIVTKYKEKGYNKLTNAEQAIMQEYFKENYSKLTEAQKETYKIFAKANYTKIDDLFGANNEEFFTKLNNESVLAFEKMIEFSPNHKSDRNQIQQAKNRLGTISKEVTDLANEVAKNLSNGDTNLENAYKDLFIVFNAYYKNNYIAGHQVNAHFFGDIAFTKNSTDLIKRMQGVKSPGKSQLTNNILGTVNTVRAITAKDVTIRKSTVDNLKGNYSKIVGKDINETDAVTFGTPQTLRLLQEGTGDYSLKDIIKTVMFYIDKNGIPHYNKTALFIITDNLAARYPELKSIRDLMERNDVQYYTYESAYKVGRPINEDLYTGNESVLERNITEWDNSYIRIQGNPYHEESYVSNPAQFNYFLNQSIDENGNIVNEVDTHNAYNIDSAIIQNKLEQLKLRTDIIDENGNVNKDKVREFLLKSLQDRDYDLLKDGTSMDYPYLVKTLIIQLSNHISKNSVQIKHSGNKLINQSDLGVTLFNGQTYEDLTVEEKKLADKFYSQDARTKNILVNYKTLIDSIDINQDSDFAGLFQDKWNLTEEEFNTLIALNDTMLVPRNLLMKDKDNFTEVIAPAWWKDKGIELGTTAAYDELLKQGFAVRIPTTGIHSGLAIKIVGFNDDINGIIVPSEVVAIHGSDFDIDSLYFMHREVAEKDYNLTLTNEELSILSPEDLANITEEPIIVSKNTLVGYTKEGKWNKDIINNINLVVSTLSKYPELKSKLSPYLELQEKILKNQKFEIYLKILTKPETQEDTTTPIEFDAVKADIDAILSDNLPDNIKASLINDKYTFKEIQDSIQIEGRKVTINNEEIKAILLNSKLGVKGKLQIAKMDTLEDSRNPNNLLHQMNMHKDNFEGRSGTGIQANLMKGISYLMQGSTVKVNGKEVASEDIIDLREEEIEIVVEETTDNNITEQQLKDEDTKYKINKEYPLHDVLKSFANTENKDLHNIYTLLRKYLPSNITFKLTEAENISKKSAGEFKYLDNKILLDYERPSHSTFIHEMAHALTHDTILKNDEFNNKITEFRIKTINYLKETDPNVFKSRNRTAYALTNNDEFLAGIFTYDKNKHFLEILNKIPSNNTSLLQDIKNLFKQLFENIANLVGIKLDKTSLLYEVINELDSTILLEKNQIEDIQELKNTAPVTTKQVIATLKDGTEGIFERNKVELKDIEFIIDGYNFNTLERVSLDGEKTTETSDTVLNGYIDNVKEQITWILNANQSTINKIGLMIYMGIPLDTITYMFNQPIMVQLSTITPFNQKKVKDNYKDDAEYELTKQDLIDSLSNPNDKVQARVIKLIDSLDKHADELDAISKQLGILRALPINEKDIKTAMSKKTISNFTSPNFYQIQHIKAAKESLNTLNDVISDTFLLSSKENMTWINNVANSIQFNSADRKLDGFERTKEELQKFLLSSWIAELKRTGEINESIYTGLDRQGNRVVKNPHTYLSREDLWVQDFISEIEEYRVTNPSKFLQYFAVKINKNTNVKYLKFNGGSSLKDDRLLDIMQGFLALSPELKRKFVIYSVLKDGARFGFKGFTNILSYKNTSDTIRDGLEDVVNHYQSVVERFSSIKENIEEMFLEQFLLTNMDLLAVNDASIFINNEFTKEIKEANSNHFVSKNPNKYIAVSDNNTNVFLYKKIDELKDIGNVFERIGMGKDSDLYTYHSAFEDKKYTMKPVISKKVEVELNKNNGEYITTYIPKFVYKPFETIRTAVVNGKSVNVKHTRTVIENENIPANIIKEKDGIITYSVTVTDEYKVQDEIDEQVETCFNNK